MNYLEGGRLIPLIRSMSTPMRWCFSYRALTLSPKHLWCIPVSSWLAGGFCRFTIPNLHPIPIPLPIPTWCSNSFFFLLLRSVTCSMRSLYALNSTGSRSDLLISTNIIYNIQFLKNIITCSLHCRLNQPSRISFFAQLRTSFNSIGLDLIEIGNLIHLLSQHSSFSVCRTKVWSLSD